MRLLDRDLELGDSVSHHTGIVTLLSLGPAGLVLHRATVTQRLQLLHSVESTDYVVIVEVSTCHRVLELGRTLITVVDSLVVFEV